MKPTASPAIFILSLYLFCNLTSSEAAELTAQQKDLMIRAEESRQCLLNSDYAGAAEILSKICDLNDNYPGLQSNYGLALVQLGKTDEGMKYLLKATSSKDALAAQWLNLASAYLHQGLALQGLAALENALRHCPTEDQTQNIQSMITIAKDQVKGSQTALNSDDYFEEATREISTRWNKMPINVYIEPSDRLSSFKPKYSLILDKAFEDWAAASAGKIIFRHVKNSKEADITVRWTDDIGQALTAAEGGDTKHKIDWSGIVSSNIVLMLAQPKNSPKFTESEIAVCAYHEIGHALGLMGHSPNVKDIMYYWSLSSDKPPLLSERDVRTIRRLYSENLKPNKYTFNHDGLLAIEAGDEKLAIEKFEQSQNLDPSSMTPRTNLIIAHHALGVKLAKAGNIEEALTNFNQALKLAEGTNVSDLETLVKSNERALTLLNKKKDAEELRKKYPQFFKS